MYQRTMFQQANEKWLSLKDLSAREIITLVPLVGMAIWIGIYPHTFLNLLARSGPEHHLAGAALPGRARRRPAPAGRRLVRGELDADASTSSPSSPN